MVCWCGSPAMCPESKSELGNATGMAWMPGHLCQVSAKGSLIYIYIYNMYVCICIYIYMYIHIYIYYVSIYMYIYIYICMFLSFLAPIFGVSTNFRRP